jgi:hypothetical protein
LTMSTDHDPFTLDFLRPGPEIQRLARSSGTRRGTPRKWKRRFIKVPWVWMDKLRATNRVQTYQLAHLVLYEHWRMGGQDIVLSNVALGREGVSRWSKWRALGELEKLGLIQIERCHRKAPRIRVLIDVPGGPS